METFYLKHDVKETVIQLETDKPEKVLEIFKDMGYEECSQEEYQERRDVLNLAGVGGSSDEFSYMRHFMKGKNRDE